MKPMRLALVLCALVIPAQLAWAQVFTYQGRLDGAGLPVNGDYDFRFKLYDASGGGTQLGPTQYRTETLAEGLFTVQLGFDSEMFDGSGRWLQIDVRPSGAGSYTALSPRQELTYAPHSLYSVHARNIILPFAGATDAEDPAFDVSNSNSISSAYAIRGVRGTPGSLPGNNPVIIGTSDSANIGVAGTGHWWGVAGFVDHDGAVGVQGEVVSGTPGATAIVATNFSSGNKAYFGTDDHAGEFVGDVLVDGDLKKRYAWGTSDPALPIAFGFINTDGSVATATPNVTCTYSSSSDRYEIKIEGENYYFNEYVTVVTCAGTPAAMTTTSSVSGKLLVYVRDTANNPVQQRFQFVTYKPTGAEFPIELPRAVVTSENPHITDADVLEQTGLQRVQPPPPPVEDDQPRTVRSAAHPD